MTKTQSIGQRLRIYDDFLLKQRGFITKMPSPGEPVVLLFSGGLDSVLTAAMLVGKYRLTVFPLFIDRGQGNIVAEKRAVATYEKLFTELFPKRFMPVKSITSDVPPTEIKSNLKQHITTHGYPLRNTQLQNLAVIYAYSLESSHGILCCTVFTASMPGDGYPHNTIESMRATTISVCENLDDWSWTITSPNCDPALGSLVSKKELVSWANDNNIPWEHTVSCGWAQENTNHLNCGICETCLMRKAIFKELGTEDATVYYSDSLKKR